MSITLDYISTEPVTEAISVQVIAEAKPLLESYDWWAEPIWIDYNGNKKGLVGSTRIRLGGYGLVNIDDDEEALMVCRDTTFVVSTLSNWSSKYKISWRLTEIGTEIGRIVDGKQSQSVVNYLSELCKNLKLPLSSVPSLLKKHEARKD